MITRLRFKRIFEDKHIKRLFLAYGILNFLISNVVLQISLLLIPTLFATFLYQVVNLLVGYNIYGKKVFKLEKLNNLILKKYLFISIISLSLNYIVIESFFYYGINKNLTAILLIPLLVSFSFFSQKYYVFKN